MGPLANRLALNTGTRIAPRGWEGEESLASTTSCPESCLAGLSGTGMILALDSWTGYDEAWSGRSGELAKGRTLDDEKVSAWPGAGRGAV